MVNKGPSKGCWTCRKRRIRCDLAKPACWNCSRRNRECGGYEPKRQVRILFKDQTSRFNSLSQVTSDPNSHAVGRTAQTRSIPAWLPPSEENFATHFFIKCIAGLGRSQQSTEGLLELVPVHHAIEKPGSVFNTVFLAVATRFWTFWSNSNHNGLLGSHLLAKAVTRIRAAIQDPAERNSDSTLLGVMLLHFFEELVARLVQERPPRTHMDGALALLNQEARTMSRSSCRDLLLGYLLSCEVSLITDGQQPLLGNDSIWYRDNAIEQISPTSRSVLNLIELSVAGIRHKCRETFAKPQDPLDKAATLATLLRDLETTQKELDQWKQMTPDLWLPQSLSISDMDSYAGVCHVYPSVPIATQWNSWRFCYIELLRLRLLLLGNIGADFPENLDYDVGEQVDAAQLQIQRLIDSICHSLPFYLGNRKQHGGMFDLQNPAIQLPSYHMFDREQDAYLKYRDSDEYMTQVDHDLHVIVQGPFHAMMHLNRLAKLLDDDHAWVLHAIVPLDQTLWIQGQLIRVRTLQRLS